MKAPEFDQMKSTLRGQDLQRLQEVIDELKHEESCSYMTGEKLKHPGKDVKEGEDGHVRFEDLSDLERIIGAPNFLPVHFLEEGAIVSSAVGRVILKQSYAGLPAGSGWATGFLVANNLLLTNNHVIPSKAFARRVRIQFNYQLDHEGTPQTSDEFEFDPDGFFHTNAALDYTLIRVKSKFMRIFNHFGQAQLVSGETNSAEMTQAAMHMPVAAAIQPSFTGRFFPFYIAPGYRWGSIRLKTPVRYALNQRVNIIQHPRGRRKEVALQSNRLTRIQTNVVKYTADTEPGSSGSPVFNNAWDLVALHHAGGDRVNGVFINNEAIRIDRVINDLRSALGGSSAGQNILQDLGI